MKKSDLVNIVMSAGNLPKKTARKIIEAIFEAASQEFEHTDQLKYFNWNSSESSALIEFGAFGLSKHKGRKRAKQMEIAMVNGEVVYKKKDGSKSDRPVAMMNQLKFIGFPIPSPNRCKSVSVISGDPFSDDVILVKAHGNNWLNNFIISKEAFEEILIPYEFFEVVKAEFDNDPPEDFKSAKKRLEDIVER
jgi:nucleoid DNA-binding protein